jgi:hypothetical protein
VIKLAIKMSFAKETLLGEGIHRRGRGNEKSTGELKRIKYVTYTCMEIP